MPEPRELVWAVVGAYHQDVWWVKSIHPTRAWAQRNAYREDQILRMEAQLDDFVQEVRGAWVVVPDPLPAHSPKPRKTLLEHLDEDEL